MKHIRTPLIHRLGLNPALDTPSSVVLQSFPNYQGTVGETSLDVVGMSGSVAPGYAYLTMGAPDGVLQYQITADGSLTAMNVAVAAGNDPETIVADSSGHYVYVDDWAGHEIWQFVVDAGGRLQALSPQVVPFPTSDGSSPGNFFYLTVNPIGRYLYVAAEQVEQPSGGSFVCSLVIAQYAIGSDGTLRGLVPPLVELPAFAFPNGPLAIDSTGQHAFLAAGDTCQGVSQHLLQFSIGSDGTLSLSADAIFSGGGGITLPGGRTIVVSPSGHEAYGLGASSPSEGLVTEYSISADGSLTPMGQAALVNPGIGASLVDLLFSGTGGSAYILANFESVEELSGAVYQYGVTASGAFTPYTPGLLGTMGTPGVGRVYGPNLYVVSTVCAGPVCQPSSYLTRFAITEAGALTQMPSTPGYARDMVLVPAE